MKLIKGQNLTPRQVEKVKAAFIYRWTIENKAKATLLYAPHSPPTIAPVSDEQWIKEHAFYFKDDGTLASKPDYAEPVYMAEG